MLNLKEELIESERQREIMQRNLTRAEEALDSERQVVQELTLVRIIFTMIFIQ